jgi:PAS domain S-box-containing protein
VADVKILLVVDESIEAMNIKRTLESFDYTVPYVASSGEEAVKKALKFMPDLILMDIILKGEGNGIEAASKIKDMNIPVIFLTAHSEESTLQKAKFTEPYGYLLKPYDVKELKLTIEIAISKHEKRKESEMALQESEEFLSNIVENIPDIIFVKSADELQFEMINKAWEEFLGYSREELLGKTDYDFFPVEEADFFTQKDREVLQNNELLDIPEETIQTKLPEKIVHTKKIPLFDETGEPSHLLGISEDITERKKLESELKESQERYRIVADFTYDWEYWIGPDRNLIYVSPSCERISGYSPEEFINDPGLLEKITHPKDVAMFRKHLLEDSTSEKYTDVIRYRIITKQGEERWISHGCQPVYSDKGTFLGRRVSNRDITERKNAEIALQKSEERFRAVAESAIDAIVTTDDNGKIRFFNNSLNTIFGYTKEELTGKPLTILMPKRFQSDYLNELEKFKKSGSHRLIGKTVATTGLKKQGTEFPFEMSLSYWKSGKKIYFTSIIRDLTEKKVAEEALRESERNYRELVDNSMVGIYKTNLKGDIIFANDAMVEMFDFESVKALKTKKTIQLYKNPKDRKNLIEKLRKDGMYSYQEVDMVSNVDKTINILLSALLEDNIISGMMIDISERKRSEKALLDSEEKFREVFNNANDAMFLHKLDDRKLGNFLEVNNVACELLGYSREELRLMSPKDIDSPETIARISQNVQKILEDGETTFEAVQFTKDGEKLPVEINTHLFTIKGEEYILSIARDIRERKKAEDEVKKSLKEKEVLLREIHHRVKNNMQIISGLLNMQIKHVEEEEAENVLQESQGRVKSMAMIHENLYRSQDLSDINFKKYVQDLVGDIFYSYGIKKGTIEPELEIKDINIDMDTAISLGLIINELVTNSVKYAFPQSKGTIQIKLKSSQDQLELIIADNGVGLLDELDYKNTDSLGLQLVNGLIDQIDGEIELDRSHGTQFKITFKE